MPLLDDIEATAKVSGSVNTVVNRNGVLSGYSTDGYGLEMSILEAFKLQVKGNTFLFWGTGGAAVAASAHFVSIGADRIFLVNRTAEKACTLKDTLQTIRKGVNIEIFRPDDINSLRNAFEIADVVIQSTSVGLKAQDAQSIPNELLVPPLKIVEMIYSGTMLMKVAKARGCDIVDGRAMLLHQGAKSFALWTGLDAPLEIMRNALNLNDSG